jgi:hypothetical protein
MATGFPSTRLLAGTYHSYMGIVREASAMHRIPACLLPVMLLALLLSASRLPAAPVAVEVARCAASNELPRFFAGPWKPSGEFALHDLAGGTVAHAFMFVRTAPAADAAADPAPAAFVAGARARLAQGGKAVAGTEHELYGADRYATIMISADDTEPVVLRCFQGLPPHVVREADALDLAGKSRGAGAWRVHRYLMRSMFDEGFAVKTDPAAAPLVVDLRNRTVESVEDAGKRTRRAAAAADAERVRLCQEAWKPYQGGAELAKQAATVARPPKKVVLPSEDATLLPASVIPPAP